MRQQKKLLLAVTVAATLAASLFLVSGAFARDEGADPPAAEALWKPAPPRHPPPPAEPDEPQALPPPPSPPPPVAIDPDVDVDIDGFLAWAALDRASGRVESSRNAAKTTSTESMIKVWIVADYLRRQAEAGKQPSKRRLADARKAIRDSDDAGAERLYRDGGADDVVKRMIKMCDLEDTEIYTYWWSRTQTSALDAVRLGECLADGTAAGPEWTDWVLTEMRKVRGTTAVEDQPMDGGGEGGRWGIIDGLPPEVLDQGVSIKNGWTRVGATDSWHLNCLAVADEWVLAVLMRYPAELSLDYGAERCASVAYQVIGAQVADSRP